MPRRPVACALAFVSGFAALGYELTWLRRLGHLWGGSALPEMFLTTCFVVGLGVGGALVARRLFRVGRPLAALAGVEAVVAVCGLSFEAALRGLWSLHASLIGGDSPSAARWAGAMAATAVLVIVPASLMGATTMLLCRAVESEDGADAKPAGGLLFGVNTVGAATGCLVTGFVLLPRLGLDSSAYVFVAANVVVAFGALFLARDERRVAPTTPAADAAAPRAPTRALVAAALLGFLGMALEYGWIRELVLLLGGSIYAFQSVLFVLLCGLGVGGVLGARIVRTRGADAAALWLTLVVVLGAAAGQWALTGLAPTLGLLAPLRAGGVANFAICAGAATVVLGAASVGMGGLFVAALSMAKPARGDESEALRRVSFANCLGGAAAGWIVMFHAFPRIGVEDTIVAAVVGFAVVRAFCLRTTPVRAGAALLLCGVAAAAAWGARSTVDSDLLRVGQFMYGAVGRGGRDKQTTLFRRDGPSCTVVVESEANGALLFRVNGKVDGSSGDMNMQVAVSVAPLCLRPNARDVLVIGYGTGSSANAAALWPETKVTCCEIEPAVVAGARWFDEINHADKATPRVRLVEDDGRRYLQGTNATYDVVVSEPSNPWLAGVTNLFTKEFYGTVRSRLNPRGIFVQWVQTYWITREDYVAVLATVRSVFPDAVVVRVTSGDSMVVACRDGDVLLPTGFAAQAQARVDATPELRRDFLQYYGTASVARFLAARVILGRDEIDALCGEAPTIVTDRNLRLEYDTPLIIFGGRTKTNPLEPVLFDAVSTSWVSRLHAALGSSPDGIEGMVELWDGCWLAGARRGQANVVAAWTAAAPTDVRAAVRGAMSVAKMPLEDVRKLAGAAFDRSRAEAMRLATVLRDQGRTEEQIEVLRVVLSRWPNDAEAAYGLCQAYLRAGRRDAAQAAFDGAVLADPCHAARAPLAKALDLSR